MQGLKALGIPLGPRRALVLRYGRPTDFSRGLPQSDNSNQFGGTNSTGSTAMGQFGRTSSNVSFGVGLSARMGDSGQPAGAADAIAEISRAVQFAKSVDRTESGSKYTSRVDIGSMGFEVWSPFIHPTCFLPCPAWNETSLVILYVGLMLNQTSSSCKFNKKVYNFR